MANASTLRTIALGLEGTEEKPHFDRAAFRVRRIYVRLAADGLTANVKLLPEEQLLKCEVAPELFSPVPNAWGRQGWTVINLREATDADLYAVLEMAHAHAVR
jgi:hypothetical protein